MFSASFLLLVPAAEADLVPYQMKTFGFSRFLCSWETCLGGNLLVSVTVGFLGLQDRMFAA